MQVLAGMELYGWRRETGGPRNTGEDRETVDVTRDAVSNLCWHLPQAGAHCAVETMP